MKIKLGIGLLVGLFIIAIGRGFAENRGAEKIVLQGGKLGAVPFSHNMHQSSLGDCNVCHTLFPRVSGTIEKLKIEGKLKKREVMTQCEVCHKQRATAGQNTGPIKCAECHKK